MVTEVFKGDKVSKMELQGLFLLFLILNKVIAFHGIHSQKKGTKAVTGTVPFQKVNFCPF